LHKLTKISFNEKFTDVIGAAYHSIALTVNNRVVCWGTDFYNTIGLTKTNCDAVEPVLVTFFADKPVSRIFSSTSAQANIVQTQSGEFYGWGDNLSGMFGEGTRYGYVLQTKIKHLCGKNIANISLSVSEIMMLLMV
jgi:alpha-tubulin suppressor-like RCC1 family protein